MVGYFCEGGGHNGRECSFFRQGVEMTGTGTAVAQPQDTVEAVAPAVAEATDLSMPQTTVKQLNLATLDDALKVAQGLLELEDTVQASAVQGMLAGTETGDERDILNHTFTALKGVDLRGKDVAALILVHEGKKYSLSDLILSTDLKDEQKKELLQGTVYNDKTTFSGDKATNEAAHRELQKLSSSYTGDNKSLIRIDPIINFANHGASFKGLQTSVESAPTARAAVSEVGGASVVNSPDTASALKSSVGDMVIGAGTNTTSDSPGQTETTSLELRESRLLDLHRSKVGLLDGIEDVPALVRRLADNRVDTEEFFKKLSAKERVEALEALLAIKSESSEEGQDNLLGAAREVGISGMTAVWNQVVRIHELQQFADSASEPAGESNESAAVSGDSVSNSSDTSGPDGVKRNNPLGGLVSNVRRGMSGLKTRFGELLTGEYPDEDVDEPKLSLAEDGNPVDATPVAEPLADTAPEAGDAVASEDRGTAEQGEPGAEEAQNLPNSEQWLEYFSGLINQQQWPDQERPTESGLVYCGSSDGKQFCLPNCGLLYKEGIGIDREQLYNCYEVLSGSEGGGFGLTKLCEVQREGDELRVTQKGTLYLPQGHKLLENRTSPTA